MYTTEHSEGLPLTLLFIGENQITAASHKQREEDHSPAPPLHRESPKIRYAPLVSDSTTLVSYTLVEDGLVTIMKDVALLDRVALKEKAGISSEAYAGAVLRRKTEQHGFAAYIGHSSTGSNKRFTLVPRGAEKRIYKGLTFEKYEDIALVAREQVVAYLEEKGRSTVDVSKVSVVHLQGREYYLASELDTIVTASAPKKQKERKEPQGASSPLPRPQRQPTIDHIIDITTYAAKGAVRDGVYTFDGRSVQLFAGEETALVKYGEVFNRFTPDDLKATKRTDYQIPLREKLFLTNAPDQKRSDTGRLVPATEKGRGKKHSLYVRDANQCLMYLVDKGYNGVPLAQEKDARSIDDIARATPVLTREKLRESGKHPPWKIPTTALASSSSSTTAVHYTLVEDGLVTIMKDVAHLDRNALWLKIRYANPAQASSFLTQKIEKLGLAIYWQNRRWGGRKRVVLIPRGSEEMIYPGLTLGKYEDIPLVAVDCAREYATAKGIETFIPQFLKVVHFKGKRYYFAAELDAWRSKKVERSEGPTADPTPVLTDSTGDNASAGAQSEILETQEAEMILLQTYQQTGERTGTDYVAGVIKRKLFADDATARVSKLYEKAGLSSPHLQAEGLELLAQTDIASHYSHPNGTVLTREQAQKRIDQSEEVRLPVAIANAAIMYIADHWAEIPPEQVASRRAWNFEEISFSATKGSGKSGPTQRYRAPVVASPNGEYIVGRDAILKELGVQSSNLHAAIPNLLELRVLGTRQREIENGQYWLIHQGDVDAIKYAIEYGKLPKNYIGHFAQ
jgi:hypothetical protein